MKWTDDDKKWLRDFRNNLDCDDVKLKQEIKQRLLNNKYIVHVLNNKELEEQDAEPEDYFGVNIRPAYIIPETQHNVQNFICYETSSNELINKNKAFKVQQIIFYILCQEKNYIDSETSLARHDLLTALIKDEFNYKLLSCGRLQLVSSKPGVTDSKYVTRTLIFECKTDSNLVKTKDGMTRIVNKELDEVTV